MDNDPDSRLEDFRKELTIIMLRSLFATANADFLKKHFRGTYPSRGEAPDAWAPIYEEGDRDSWGGVCLLRKQKGPVERALTTDHC